MKILHYKHCKTIITIGIDHHLQKDQFATCGDKVDIWDISRATPIQTYDWGIDTIDSIKYNPVEVRIMCYLFSIEFILWFCCYYNKAIH